jgi:type IV pilus assembly protein PilO
METERFLENVGKIKMPVRIAILVGTVAALAAMFVWLVYIPKTADIAKLDKEIEILERKLNKAKMKAKNLEKFEAEFAEVDMQFKQALKLLPNKKEIPRLLKSVTKLGNDSKLEFRLFSPQKERARDFIMEIPVSIEVSGTYHDVAVFFDRVGRMERIVNILNVSMKPVKERSTDLITKCDAVTYRFKGGSDVDADAKVETKKKKKKKRKKR